MSLTRLSVLLTWSTGQLTLLYWMEKVSRSEDEWSTDHFRVYDSWNQPHLDQMTASRFWSDFCQTISISSHGHGTSSSTFHTGRVLGFVAVDTYSAPMVVVPSLTAAAPGGGDAHRAHGDGGEFVARVVGIGGEWWQPAGGTVGRGLWSSVSGCSLDAFCLECKEMDWWIVLRWSWMESIDCALQAIQIDHGSHWIWDIMDFQFVTEL